MRDAEREKNAEIEKLTASFEKERLKMTERNDIMMKSALDRMTDAIILMSSKISEMTESQKLSRQRVDDRYTQLTSEQPAGSAIDAHGAEHDTILIPPPPDDDASGSAIDADVDISKNIQNPVVAIIQEVYCSFYLFLISLQKIQEIPLYIKEIPEEEHEEDVITEHVKARKRKSKRNKNSNKNNPTNGNNNQTSNNLSSNKNNLTKDNNNLNSNNPKTQKDRQQWLKSRIDDKKTPKNRKDEYITQLEQLRLTD